jgi:hypothetical protein
METLDFSIAACNKRMWEVIGDGADNSSLPGDDPIVQKIKRYGYIKTEWEPTVSSVTFGSTCCVATE